MTLARCVSLREAVSIPAGQLEDHSNRPSLTYRSRQTRSRRVRHSSKSSGI